MSRLYTMNPNEATGLVAETFSALKHSAGMVPNAYLTIGTHSPEGLNAMLLVDEVVANSDLPRADVEIVRLIVSNITGCHYCVAAHSLMAKFSGVLPSVIRRIQAGEPTGHRRHDALIRFVKQLVQGRGILDQEELALISEAGYSQRQVVEISLAIASTVFISTVNRINDTEIDFPDGEGI